MLNLITSLGTIYKYILSSVIAIIKYVYRVNVTFSQRLREISSENFANEKPWLL